MTRAIARARARARVARHRDDHGLPRRTHGRRRLAVGGGCDRALRAVRAEQVSAVRGQEEPHVRSAPPTAASASGCRHLADVLAGLANGLAQTVADASVVLWKARQPFRPAPTAGVWLCLLLRVHRLPTASRGRSNVCSQSRRIAPRSRSWPDESTPPLGPRAGGDGRGRPCVPAPQAAGLDRSVSPVVRSWRVAHPTEARQVGGTSPTTEPILLTPASPVLVRERDIWSPTPPGAWSGLGQAGPRRVRA
jgi:hypothetical protein